MSGYSSGAAQMMRCIMIGSTVDIDLLVMSRRGSRSWVPKRTTRRDSAKREKPSKIQAWTLKPNNDDVKKENGTIFTHGQKKNIDNSCVSRVGIGDRDAGEQQEQVLGNKLLRDRYTQEM